MFKKGLIYFFVSIAAHSCSSAFLTLATSNYPPLVFCDQGTKMSSKSNVSFSGLEIDFIKYSFSFFSEFYSLFRKVLTRMNMKPSDYEINCIDSSNYQNFLDNNHVLIIKFHFSIRNLSSQAILVTKHSKCFFFKKTIHFPPLYLTQV